MATKLEALQELVNRGEHNKLPPKKRAAVDELIKRGELTVPEFDFSFKKMVKNIPSSGKQFAKDITYPFIHPVQTAQSVQTLGQGLLEKALPEIQTAEGGFGPTENEQVANQVGGMLKNRYGGWENIQRTLQNDPVGLLADVSGLLSMGGAAVPGKLGKTTQLIGKTVDPFNLITNTGMKTVGKMVPKGKPVSMMTQAVKWPISKKTPLWKRNKWSQTMLDEGIMPSYLGLKKAWDTIDDLNSKIDDLIEVAEKSGKKIPRKKVFRYLDDAKKSIAEKGAGGLDEMKQMDAFRDNLEGAWAKYNMDEFTPTQLQEFKKDLYSITNYETQNLKSSRGTTSARKKTAKAAREDIEQMAGPEIRDLNAREGRLLDMTDALEPKAARIENRNTLPLTLGTNTGAGAIIDYTLGLPGVGTALGITGTLFDMPLAKAKTAHILYGLQNAAMTDNLLAPLILRQGLLQSGRLGQE
ncbi:MAG: hypothetical protein GTN99_07000 [Candidatus Dadabacteria bacterium]|nr:hypothetical protein [Candidatus Dadabacteria bacterium]